MLGREQILELIPHQGVMCLLDAVLEWDPQHICCSANSHRSLAHPLARDGQLSSVHLIEYGAQAMALHGGLLAAREHRRVGPGMLVAVREVIFEVARIDDLTAPLLIRATQLLAQAGGWLYQFEASANDLLLARGRVAVIGPRP